MFSKLYLHMYRKLLTDGTWNLVGRQVEGYTTSVQCRQYGWPKISRYAESMKNSFLTFLQKCLLFRHHSSNIVPNFFPSKSPKGAIFVSINFLLHQSLRRYKVKKKFWTYPCFWRVSVFVLKTFKREHYQRWKNELKQIHYTINTRNSCWFCGPSNLAMWIGTNMRCEVVWSVESCISCKCSST